MGEPSAAVEARCSCDSITITLAYSLSRLVPASDHPGVRTRRRGGNLVLALLLFLGLVLMTVLLGFLAAVQGGMRGSAAINPPRRIVELSRRVAEQAPPDTLGSTSP